jgi:chemotaxis protein methyltransferase CheR
MNQPTMACGDFEYIRHLVRDRSALILDSGKEYLVESRLNPVAQQHGLPSVQGLIARLRRAPFGELHRKVVESMTNNETTFFRDARVFAMLKNALVPELIARKAAERSINIWCAACSSGQEPYSIAMLLRECLAVRGWKLRIVASDLSRDVLARAAAGRYTQLEINRGLPANLLVKYFEQVPGAWQIRPEIRSMVEFLEINLIDAWPALPPMDVVLLRNVLIYFDVETKRTVLRRMSRVLEPRGWLFLGGAETIGSLDDSFESIADAGVIRFRPKSSAAGGTLAEPPGGAAPADAFSRLASFDRSRSRPISGS